MEDKTAELVKALGRARAKFAPIAKDGTNPHLHNRYATLGATLEAVSHALLAEGIVPSQTPVPLDGGHWALETTLWHESGAKISGTVPLIYGEAKGLNPMQALGSAISYARRYGLLALLCLTAEDDDAASAGQPPAVARVQDRVRNGPPPRREPTPQEAAEARRKALYALEHKPPQTGKGLFRLLIDLDPQRGLLKAVNAFGRDHGWGPQLVEWSTPHVLEALAFVRDEIEVAAAADREVS